MRDGRLLGLGARGQRPLTVRLERVKFAAARSEAPDLLINVRSPGVREMRLEEIPRQHQSNTRDKGDRSDEGSAAGEAAPSVSSKPAQELPFGIQRDH